MINSLIKLVKENPAVSAFLATHFGHLSWPAVKAAWPAFKDGCQALKANGGLLRMIRDCIWSDTKLESVNKQQPKKENE